MKSKNIFKFFVVGLAIFTMSACSKYIELNPISSYNSGSFYKTEADFGLAVNGIYSQLRSMTNVTLPANLEERSDNLAKDPTDSYDESLVGKFVENASTGSVASIWSGYYNLITRCNSVLGTIDAGTFTTEANRAYYKGEAQFIRGYAYFQLGWIYGGVPLLDHVMTSEAIKAVKRSTQDETFAFAAKDLIAASSNLPVAWAGTNIGKATKYAAEGILARMYMFQKKFSDAKPLLLDIINSGKYTMAATYANCFLDTYDNSPEHVFQIQFTSGGLGQGNSFVMSCVPELIRSALFPIGGQSTAYLVSYDLYNSYESGDLRRDFTIMKGWTNAGGVTDTYSLYYIKFAHGTMPSDKSDYAVNGPILRYTDVKLMYAEVLNEEGYNASGEAFNIINAVRARAGITPLTATTVPTQQAFRDALLKERRVEFACEMLRWFDLVRTGKALTTIQTFLALKENGSGTYKMDAYRILFPIPQVELNVNTNTAVLWQNPGY
ncbi:MAG: RagB/SusD family nutrient uptake outer membrane protein [Bacteroidetes bacterium]|nr:RagB/SusD family nutrient uptake outer membrane protein [Bacteroidota bacterium]